MNQESPRSAERSRRFVIALGLNSALVVAETISAFLGHSVVLGADAGHNLVDVGGLVLALCAIRLAQRSPTARRSFGYARATIVAGFVNLIIVLVLTVVITIGAIERLVHPVPIHGGIIAVLGAVGVVVNLCAAMALREPTRDLNVRTAVLHLTSDAISSGAVLVAGIVITVSGRFDAIDPIVSLVIAALIAFGGLRLWNEYTQILLEAVPLDIDLNALATTIREIPGVAGVHDLHCWSLSSEVRALSAHVVVQNNPSLIDAQRVSDDVKRAVESKFHIEHATLELESTACAPDDEACGIGPTNARTSRAS